MATMDVDARGRIPPSILKGFIPRYRSVHVTFMNTVIIEFMTRIYNSYLERSHLDDVPDMRRDEEGYSPKYGRTDDKGNSWEQLRPNTYRIKKQIVEEGSHRDYIRKRANTQNKGLRERIEKLAEILDNTNFEADGINIRTGRLLAAHHPPRLGGNNQIYPGRDQNFVVTNSSIHFETTVEYADEVDKLRELVPEDSAQEWMMESIAIALNRAEETYLRLKTRYDAYNEKRRKKR